MAEPQAWELLILEHTGMNGVSQSSNRKHEAAKDSEREGAKGYNMTSAFDAGIFP